MQGTLSFARLSATFSLTALVWVQANAFDQEKVDWLVENCPTCVQIFQGFCKIYAERPMFGFCMPGSDEWQTISYKQVYERVVHFAAGVHPIDGHQG